MKLGSDYTPQQSGKIIGKVRGVKELEGSYVLVFEILGKIFMSEYFSL